MNKAAIVHLVYCLHQSLLFVLKCDIITANYLILPFKESLKKQSSLST